MNFIPDWTNKDLTCKFCGTKKSVKWQHLGENFCNKHILLVADSKTTEEMEVIRKKWYSFIIEEKLKY